MDVEGVAQVEFAGQIRREKRKEKSGEVLEVIIKELDDENPNYDWGDVVSISSTLGREKRRRGRTRDLDVGMDRAQQLARTT